MSLSSLDCSPQWVYCSALLLNREHTWNCLPAESPSQCIWLTSNLIFTDSVLCSKVHVTSFCLSGGRNSATCLCEKAPTCLVNGRSSTLGVFTAATGSVPAQEQTRYKHLKYVLTWCEPHSLWCLSEDRRTLKSLNLVSCVQSFDMATQSLIDTVNVSF